MLFLDNKNVPGSTSYKKINQSSITNLQRHPQMHGCDEKYYCIFILYYIYIYIYILLKLLVITTSRY